jgi:hypothetical protein
MPALFAVPRQRTEMLFGAKTGEFGVLMGTDRGFYPQPLPHGLAIARSIFAGNAQHTLGLLTVDVLVARNVRSSAAFAESVRSRRFACSGGMRLDRQRNGGSRYR